jgi:hypothetical protein
MRGWRVDNYRVIILQGIFLTQLRNSYSFLNYDLSKVNIVNDAACSCGAPREDAFHYFVTCPNYTVKLKTCLMILIFSSYVKSSDPQVSRFRSLVCTQFKLFIIISLYSYFSIVRTSNKIMECIFPWSSGHAPN